MVCGAAHDPVAAIFLHSTPADVDMVIVEGIVKKKSKKLLGLELDHTAASFANETRLSWPEIASKLLPSREVLQQRMEGIDQEEVERGIQQGMGLDQSLFVDGL